MNRKKKVKQTLLKQAKKQRAKNAPSAAKSKYVSKADRAALEVAPDETQGVAIDVDSAAE